MVPKNPFAAARRHQEVGEGPLYGAEHDEEHSAADDRLQPDVPCADSAPQQIEHDGRHDQQQREIRRNELRDRIDTPDRASARAGNSGRIQISDTMNSV